MTDARNNVFGGKVVNCEDDAVCKSVSCESCLADIPTGMAYMTEGEDYVHHFCGSHCLEAWQKKQGEAG